MPRLATPSGMPEEISRMIEVIGNQVRTELLRRLADGPQTAVDLAGLIEVAHSSVHRHLIKLESVGLVTADTESGHRVGSTTVRWSVDSERIRAIGEAWISYAVGD